jgi:hypothetical protein|tara:strand:+ start:212 stop:400 length:189 start_codon:yes stop_codon:yes gene_type:complete
MTGKELRDKLDIILEKLRTANTNKNSEEISHQVKKLNGLWNKASVEMLKNAEKDGFFPEQKD